MTFICRPLYYSKVRAYVLSMKTALTTLILSLLLLGCSDARVGNCDVTEHDHPSIGNIQGDGSFCTAWAIDETHLVTAAHCVRRVSALWKFKGRLVQPYATLWIGDQAIMELVEGESFEPMPISLTNTVPAELIGAGCSETGALQTKYINENNEACTCSGDSGSPILNGEGKVIGVLSAKVKTGKNLGFLSWSELDRIVRLLPSPPGLVTE